MENRRRTRSKRPDELRSSAIATPSKRSSIASVPVVTTRTSPGIRRQASPGRRQSPGRRASPARAKRVSPVRRSSRPRSTTLGVSASTSSAKPSTSMIMEDSNEISVAPKASAAVTSFARGPINPTGPAKATTIIDKTQLVERSASTYSTYSSVTTKTVEMSASGGNLISDIDKLGNSLSRSAPRTFVDAVDLTRRSMTRTPSTTVGSNTDGGSRYSRSVSRSVYDDDNGEFSENDETSGGGGDHFRSFNNSMQSATLPSTALLCRKLSVPREFGGWLGASLLLLLMPPLLYYLQQSCGKTACGFVVAWPQLQSPAELLLSLKPPMQRLFRLDAVLAYVAFNVGVFVLSALMPGRFVQLPRETRASNIVEYKFNAAPIAILLMLAAAAAEYLGYPVAHFVLRHYDRFNVYALLNAFVMAAWCYVRPRVLLTSTAKREDPAQLNAYAKSGNLVVDYALGRELNPKWLGFVDYKQVFHCIMMLTTLLYAGCFIYKNVHLTGERPVIEDFIEDPLLSLRYFSAQIKYDVIALLTSSMLLAYVSDAILFEHHLASSFELQGEGFGALLLLRYAATPPLLAGVANYSYYHRIPLLCNFAVYVAIALFLSGLAIKRFSCAIKYNYRMQPSHPQFGDVETVHTFQGRRLLLGTFWGRLRQPNYAGDILALAGLAVPLFLQFAWPPLVGLLLIVALLLHRATRVDARNKARYQSSWMCYRNRSRYYIVPFVY